MVLTAVCLLGGAATPPVEGDDIRALPGYVELEAIAIPKDAQKVKDIDLGPALLQLAAEAESQDGSKLAQALSKIRSLRVKAFSLDEKRSERVRGQIDRIQAQLDADGWQRLVSVRDGQELVTVSVLPAGDHFAGMLVMAFTPGEEAAFVNLVGELSPSTFAEIAHELLHDDKLEELFEAPAPGDEPDGDARRID